MAPLGTDEVQDRIDAENAKGYRGARVDPEPNSAYSQETDPMTSPRAARHGTNFMHIDEYADPDNPEYEHIYGRMGLDSEEGQDRVEALGETTDVVVVLADASAATGQSTTGDTTPDDDGLVEAATFRPVATITGHADNHRIFTLRNATKGEDLASITTVATKTADTDYAMTLDGSPTVSAGDELQVVETVAGTGVAHGGATVTVRMQQTDTA
jgi:hypothetical protein